jgi:hypothetical protein
MHVGQKVVLPVNVHRGAAPLTHLWDAAPRKMSMLLWDAALNKMSMLLKSAP